VILITARAAGPYQAANWEFIGDAEQTISVFVLAALAFWNAPAAFASPFSSTVQRTLLVKPARKARPCFHALRRPASLLREERAGKLCNSSR